MSTAEQEKHAKSCLAPFSNFTLQSFHQPIELQFPQTFESYESSRSGMRVVIVKQDLPVAYGYFVFPTTACDDDGIPHTLEHLVFMGSKRYPHASFLEKVANRAFSSINAYTDIDHTCYEVESAGWQGMMQVLPIYLDHLFFPNLTDDACYTEVHHVDGNGLDAGVVYAEMQARGNQKYDVAELVVKRAIYPEGHPYRYETGGLVSQLRSLTAERIRDYHRSTYLPSKLTLILEGDIDRTDLFRLLDQWEDALETDRPDMITLPHERSLLAGQPGTFSPPKLKGDVIVARFGDSDESSGEIQLIYNAPPFDAFSDRFMYDVLLDYLFTETAGIISLQVVEESHLASMITWSVNWCEHSLLTIWLADVHVRDMDKVTGEWLSLVDEVCRAPINMGRMGVCLDQYINRYCSSREIASGYNDDVIVSALYGNRADRLTDGCFRLRELMEIKETSSLTGWTATLRRWFEGVQHLVVHVRPDARLLKDLNHAEQARLEQQKLDLDEEHARLLSTRLEAAKERNEAPLEKGWTAQYPTPDVNGIRWPRSSTTVVDRIGFDLQYEDVPSLMAVGVIWISIPHIPQPLRPFLNLLMEGFFSTDLSVAGRIIPFTTVHENLSAVATDFRIDFDWEDQESVKLRIKHDPQDLAGVTQQLSCLFNCTVHNESRLKTQISKLRRVMKDERRDADLVASEVTRLLHSSGDAAAKLVYMSFLYQNQFLRRVEDRLCTDRRSVFQTMTQVRDGVAEHIQNARFLMSAPLTRCQNPTNAWQILHGSTSNLKAFEQQAVTEPASESTAILPDRSRVQADAQVSITAQNTSAASNVDQEKQKTRHSRLGTAYVVPLSNADSCQISCSVSSLGPSERRNPDHAALLVAASLLELPSGFLWDTIRGSGLAYGLSCRFEIHNQMLELGVDRVSQPHQAMLKLRDSISGLADGSLPIEEEAVEEAVSATVFSTAENLSSFHPAAEEKYRERTFRDGYATAELLTNVRRIRAPQVREAIKKYILPAVLPETGKLVIVAPTQQAEEVCRLCRADGWAMEARSVFFFERHLEEQFPDFDEIQATLIDESSRARNAEDTWGPRSMDEARQRSDRRAYRKGTYFEEKLDELNYILSATDAAEETRRKEEAAWPEQGLSKFEGHDNNPSPGGSEDEDDDDDDDDDGDEADEVDDETNEDDDHDTGEEVLEDAEDGQKGMASEQQAAEVGTRKRRRRSTRTENS